MLIKRRLVARKIKIGNFAGPSSPYLGPETPPPILSPQFLEQKAKKSSNPPENLAPLSPSDTTLSKDRPPSYESVFHGSLNETFSKSDEAVKK